MNASVVTLRLRPLDYAQRERRFPGNPLKETPRALFNNTVTLRNKTPWNRERSTRDRPLVESGHVYPLAE
jgi:hypothetical protein